MRASKNMARIIIVRRRPERGEKFDPEKAWQAVDLPGLFFDVPYSRSDAEAFLPTLARHILNVVDSRTFLLKPGPSRMNRIPV